MESNLKRIMAMALTALFTLTVFFAASPHATAGGMVIAHYQLNGNFKDVSGNGNDGTSIGNVHFENDSTVGTCAVFDGGFIKVKSSPALNLGSQGKPFSVSVWVLLAEKKAYGIISKMGGPNNSETFSLYYEYTPRMHFTNVVDFSGNFLENEGRWIHLIYSYDGQSLYGYVDGKLIASQDISREGQIGSSNGEIMIGNDDRNEFLKGKMADLRIYSYALSYDEISNIYQSGANPGTR